MDRTYLNSNCSLVITCKIKIRSNHFSLIQLQHISTSDNEICLIVFIFHFSVDLFLMYKIVSELGGYSKVIKHL